MDQFSFFFSLINSDHLPNPPIVICDGIQTTEWFISSNRVLQPSLFRVYPDQQQDCHWGCHFSCVLTFRQPIRHHNPHLEGTMNIPQKCRVEHRHVKLDGFFSATYLCGCHALGSWAHRNIGWRRFLKIPRGGAPWSSSNFPNPPLMYPYLDKWKPRDSGRGEMVIFFSSFLCLVPSLRRKSLK